VKVAQGAWIGGNETENTNEVNALIEQAQRQSNIVMAVVGSEALLRYEKGWGNGVSESDLIAHIHRVQQAVNVPVTTAEPWHIWTNHPALATSVDLILMNVHPYWEQQPSAEHCVLDVNIRHRERTVVEQTGGHQRDGLALRGSGKRAAQPGPHK